MKNALFSSTRLCGFTCQRQIYINKGAGQMNKWGSKLAVSIIVHPTPERGWTNSRVRTFFSELGQTNVLMLRRPMLPGTRSEHFEIMAHLREKLMFTGYSKILCGKQRQTGERRILTRISVSQVEHSTPQYSENPGRLLPPRVEGGRTTWFANSYTL